MIWLCFFDLDTHQYMQATPYKKVLDLKGYIYDILNINLAAKTFCYVTIQWRHPEQRALSHCLCVCCYLSPNALTCRRSLAGHVCMLVH